MEEKSSTGLNNRTRLRAAVSFSESCKRSDQNKPADERSESAGNAAVGQMFRQIRCAHLPALEGGIIRNGFDKRPWLQFSHGNSFLLKPAGRIALCILAALTVLVTTIGCGAPPATLELVSVAQKAISDASAYERDRHAENLNRLDGLSASLDAAFDADVKLIAVGGITDSAGKPIPLTAEWVISARKGYAAARDALAKQRRRTQASHATHLDNLSAAVEALDLARMLIIQHSTLTGRARQFLMSLQRRFVNER